MAVPAFHHAVAAGGHEKGRRAIPGGLQSKHACMVARPLQRTCHHHLRALNPFMQQSLMAILL
jgi:hypothetical protein